MGVVEDGGGAGVEELEAAAQLAPVEVGESEVGGLEVAWKGVNWASRDDMLRVLGGPEGM